MFTTGAVPAVLIPVSMKKREQFSLVVNELKLQRKPPRCMTCGGVLQAVDKDSVIERIPPKTRPWLDDYYVCARCGQLFWQGTHWERIERQLQTMLPVEELS